jgi:hypothetical protein
MASDLASTVPGALIQLYNYCQTIASKNTNFESGAVAAYYGIPLDTVENNYIMVGDDETGSMLVGYKQSWVGFPASFNRKGEDYDIPVSIRTWAGGSGDPDKQARMTEAWILVNALINSVMSDPNGKANGLPNLTASGSWQVAAVGNPVAGPLAGKGWGVVIAVTVEVRNVRIQG